MENKTEKKSSKKQKKKNIKDLNIPSLKTTKILSRNILSTEKKSSKEDENIFENETYFTQDREKNIKRVGNEIRKFEFIYSPRTTFILEKEKEEKLLRELCNGFDPITIKIMKSYFKERLGELNKQDFIGILQKNLLTWHPELPYRENILIKLLSKIFDEIDLDNNNKIDWEEFTYFILGASDNKNNIKNYDLKYFVPLKKNIDDSEFVDIVSHAFYISKYNLVGIAIEGKSYIMFYDPETCKKQKAYIDVKETQEKIDRMKYKELEQRANEELIRKEEEKRINLRNHFNLQKLKNINLGMNETSFLKNKKNFMRQMTSTENNFSENNNNNKEKKDDTPEKLKQELKMINVDYFKINKKDFNKKLTILCTVFVDEYDTLFISSSNNKISAWKYEDGDFKNVNKLENEVKDKDIFSCAILDAELPQQTMDWDPAQKYLYSGQADGKILMWDINKTKNIENATLDYTKAKERHEEDLRKHKVIDIDKIDINEENYDEETIRTYLNNIDKNELKNSNDNSMFKTKTNKSPEKQKKIKLFNDKLLMNNKIDVSIESVSCLKILGKMQILAAGYYNGNLLLWDTILREHRKFYTDQKTGIYQIDYNINKNLIFTCGFDHDIYIYDPYVDGRCVQKLTGHNYSINSIACINSENEFVSIDIYGNIKIWDLINNYNYQTINLNETLNLIKIQNNQSQIKKKISSNQKMIFLSKAKKILTFGEKLMMFGMVKDKLTDLCDNQLVLGCFYKPSKYCFYTVCLKKIKIWNMLNGKLKAIYDNFLINQNSEITSFCTDISIKKIFIGDCFGNISILNINSGKILKSFQPHKTEILAMCHSTKLNILISLSTDSVIKIHKDEIDEIKTLREFTLDDIIIKTIKYNETYSRVILGTSRGELKYFDVEHLKHDSSSGKEKITKLKNEDAINEIYSFEDYPLCISFHESSLANFEIIPPTYYKFRSFGDFNNVIVKDNTEIKVKIISCDFDNINQRLFAADFFGYVHCYSLKELFDILKNINMVIGSDEDLKYINMLESYKIKKLFCFQAHKEKIKQINYPKINPNIIVTTGSDRRVKLFSAEDGTYIDEFIQSSENLKEYPIGLRYYFSDPFISKINEGEVIKNDIVYRKDIVGFKLNRFNIELNKMKKELMPLNEYLTKLVNLNAKERLYLITKNIELPLDKSSNWKYNPNLDEIISNEKNTYIDQNIKNYKKLEFNPVESKYYYPTFIKEMNDQQIKDFSNALNNKIRRVKLTMAKLQIDSERYKNYENEEKKRIRNISFQNEMKVLFGNTLNKKEFNSPKLEKLNAKRSYNFGIVKTFKNIGDRFDNYKTDFNMKLNEFENAFQNKLVKRYTFTQKNKNNSNIRSFKTTKIKSPLNSKKMSESNKVSSTWLPALNTTKNNIKKNDRNISLIKTGKKVGFKIKDDSIENESQINKESMG